MKLAAGALAGFLCAIAVAVEAQPQQPPAPAPPGPAAPPGRGGPARWAAEPRCRRWRPRRSSAPKRILAETRKAMGGDKFDGHANDRGDGPHAARARRQPRPDRIRDQHRAARQVRPQGRGARGREPADIHGVRRQRDRPVSTGSRGTRAWRRSSASARRTRSRRRPGRSARGRTRPGGATDPGTARSAAGGSPHDSQAGVRAADARAAAVHARNVSAHVRLRGSGSRAARHRRRPRRSRRRQLRGPSLPRLRHETADHDQLAGATDGGPRQDARGGRASLGPPGRRDRRRSSAAGAARAPKPPREYTKQVAALRQKAQATPVEYRIYYADYRDVDGVKLPFRLRRAIGADTTEETSFDRFRLNTKIDPRKFAVPK